MTHDLAGLTDQELMQNRARKENEVLDIRLRANEEIKDKLIDPSDPYWDLVAEQITRDMKRIVPEARFLQITIATGLEFDVLDIEELLGEDGEVVRLPDYKPFRAAIAHFRSEYSRTYAQIIPVDCYADRYYFDLSTKAVLGPDAFAEQIAAERSQIV